MSLFEELDKPGNERIRELHYRRCIKLGIAPRSVYGISLLRERLDCTGADFRSDKIRRFTKILDE